MSGPGLVLAVLFEEDDAAVGGASRAFLRTVPALERRGWRFAFWASRPSAVAEEVAASGHAVAGRPRDLRFSLRELRTGPGPVARLASGPGYLRAVGRAVRGSGAVLVHANTLAAVPEAAVARALGVPVVVHAHEILPRGAKSRAQRGAALALGEVVAPSEATARQFGGRARVVPNGVVLPAAGRPGGEAVGRPDRRLVVGLLGAIRPRKGTDVLVEAARHLDRERFAVRLAGSPVVGADAAWAARVLEEARAAGVEVVGRVDGPAELASWDVLVLPSREDPFPNVVLEAMALGVPVVASRVGGIPEQVGDDAGVLVPPDDPAALAEALRRLADDPARRAALAEAGRRRVAARFTLERQAEGLDAAYRAALRGGVRA